MDKDEYEATIGLKGRNTHWMRYGYKSRKGITYATASWGSDEPCTNPWYYKYIDGLLMDCVQDGKLAKTFSNGEKKLIPIIFSHGLTCNRTA